MELVVFDPKRLRDVLYAVSRVGNFKLPEYAKVKWIEEIKQETAVWEDAKQKIMERCDSYLEISDSALIIKTDGKILVVMEEPEWCSFGTWEINEELLRTWVE